MSAVLGNCLETNINLKYLKEKKNRNFLQQLLGFSWFL